LVVRLVVDRPSSEPFYQGRGGLEQLVAYRFSRLGAAFRVLRDGPARARPPARSTAI